MRVVTNVQSLNDQDVNETNTAVQPGADVFSLLQVAHALEDRLEAALAGVGLSGPKFTVISELKRAGKPLPLSDLASRLSCVKSNMTQLVDRLEADGLVKRVDDPSDRRAVKAALTEAGLVKAKAGAAEIDRLNGTLAAALRAEDRLAIERVMTALK
jgi:DNA-binding MarR family transcriptional regulator